MKKAVFLDRDGVLIQDVNLASRPEDIRVYEYVPEALNSLVLRGFELVIVSNQPIVARGVLSEKGVVDLNQTMFERIGSLGGPLLRHFYFCPHHPKATLPEYRKDCECRKPRTGMIQEAARIHGIELKRSYMIGDRITDVIAGRNSGCKAILVETGEHLKPPIESTDGIDPEIAPDWVFPSLKEAAAWISSIP